ncbi:putative HC-toxin efflux carrier TOXA [Aspergillus udagawae]|uniref:HC-toxin efflux carrier TOXA n=1 Tax=Aspergillus udagawae TaxID=91492 RepID=A0ABQ1A705_9EURO|nr:putative HC-toxin efflux carrier TOXA [Aspergillus udagawae]GFF75094.1 putative HC-toxin efflux carrier TOXA [Aspergillus udagawae]GFG22325.1 putative HC-toxin efflux carrier TOXA [Aspergillus udagawae]
MNERRAVLSCFLLSSSISQFLCKPDPMRWTAHMKECLEVLTERKETPNDAVLVQLIRIQLVVDKLIRRSWDESGTTGEGSDSPRLPTSFFIRTMQQQLQSIRSRIPPELADNKVVLFHLYQAEMAVYETAMSRSAIQVEDVDVTRISHLYACLSATKNWLDLLLTISPEEYVSLPVTIIFQVSHCLSTLFYLSTFDYPGWDREAVTRTADLQAISQQVIDRLDSVAEAAGIQNQGTEGDSWSKAARILPKLQASWASKLPNAVVPAVNAGGQSSAPSSIDEGFLEAYVNWPDVWLMESLMLGSQNGV